MAEGLEDLKHTPLFALHQELGARLVPFAGTALPVQYDTGIMAEHLWTRSSAGLFDVSHMGQIQLIGPGVEAALERLVPGDLAILRPGRMRYSLLLNAQGGILDDLMITQAGSHLYLVVNGAMKHDDLKLLRDGLPPEIKIRHRTDWALLALQGPQAVTALARLVPGAAALTFMQSAPFSWRGIDMIVSRSGYTGEDGFEIALAGLNADVVARALLAQSEVKPVGLGARDSLRLEAGLPLYGHDLTPQTTPAEADLAFAVSKRRKTEGGFPGSAHVNRQILEGASRKRVGFKLEGRQPAREGAAIYSGDTCIGAVTSGGFSPSLQAPVAMGYVAIAQAGDGTPVEIDVRGKRLPARVTPMPFVPHRYVRSATSSPSSTGA